MRLTPLAHQIIVLTGASSGVGLATARLAAARGAGLGLVARSGPALWCQTASAGGTGRPNTRRSTVRAAQ